MTWTVGVLEVVAPPNTRVQRTRSSPSAHREPLTRRPLGRKLAPAHFVRAPSVARFGIVVR